MDPRLRAMSSNPVPLLIACAAGFSGDRTDAAAPLVRELVARGGPACLIFENLAERTLAIAQQARRRDPEAGYEPLLVEQLQPILSDCLAAGIRIVSNFGAANPMAAARRIRELARQCGARSPRIAVVSGDDLSGEQHRVWLLSALGETAGADVISANAYIGSEAIAAALREGADVVVCGRVADPCLTLGPAMAHFGWAADDWDALAAGTIAGHLLECGAQVTGGYFADPGFKEVPGLHDIGYPIVELHADGRFIVSKPAGTGGRVDVHTVTEQLLYEVHDPCAYLTPDVVADLSEVTLEDIGADRVTVLGVRGHPRTDTLKVNVCREQGWVAEGEISYAGARAEARARLAAEVLVRRLPDLAPLRVDLIGVLSVWGDDAGRLLSAQPPTAVTDVRLRVAARHPQRESAQRLCREVTALYTCGPAGGGGVRTALHQRLSTVSCLVPRERVPVQHHFLED